MFPLILGVTVLIVLFAMSEEEQVKIVTPVQKDKIVIKEILVDYCAIRPKSPLLERFILALEDDNPVKMLENLAISLESMGDPQADREAKCFRLMMRNVNNSLPNKVKLGCQSSPLDQFLYIVQNNDFLEGNSAVNIASKFFGTVLTPQRLEELVDINNKSVEGFGYTGGCKELTGNSYSVARELGNSGIKGTLSYNFNSISTCDVLLIPRTWNPWIDQIGTPVGNIIPWPMC